MESIVIKPKNKKNLQHFIKLAEELEVEIHSFSEHNDLALLNKMHNNFNSPKINKEDVLNTIN